MVVHGEDSLTENTEREGLRSDSALDTLRMKLGKSVVPVERPESAGDQTPSGDSEPTHEQLVATGEAGEGGADEGDKRPEGSTTRDLIVPDKEQGIRKQIEEGLLAGESRADLIARGFNKRSVETVASELKSKLHSRKPIGKEGAPRVSPGTAIFAHGSPPEAIIEGIVMPDVADGSGVAFEQGLKFGMSLVIMGVRVAQELSGIGVAQAKPIVEMAKSMREGEAMASKNAAGEAAMEAAGMVQQSLMPILANLQKNSGGGSEGGDPVKAMMVRTMEPIMQKLMGGMLGRLVPGAQPPQLTQGQGSVDGWTRRSE